MVAGKLAPLHVALLRGINVSGKNTLPMAYYKDVTFMELRRSMRLLEEHRNYLLER